MKTIKFMLSVAGAMLLSTVVQAATASGGRDYTKAVSLSASSTAKAYALVNEYDPEYKEYWDSGAAYFKFSVTRGKAYTLTVKTLSSESGLSVSVDDISSYDWEKDVYLPSFSGETDPDGVTERYTLLVDDWDLGDTELEDPGHDKSGTFYVYVSGDIGDTCEVQLQNGEIPYTVPEGSVDNPIALSSISTTAATAKGTVVDDNVCYFQIKLTKNKRYKFWTTGGSEDHDLSISAEAAEGVATPDTYSYSDGVTTYNDGVVVVPTATGNHLICVSGQAYGDQFTLNYQQAPARTIAKHPATELATPKTEAVTEACEPGYRNDPASGYDDQIIDSELFKVALVKGKYYRFSTDGASTDLVMELYDANGKVLLTNEKGFPEGYDCCFVYKAAASTTYYVGVCQDLEDGATTGSTPCTFKVELVADDPDKLDKWDHGDDKLAGASLIVPALGTTAWTTGEAHEPHRLSATDWADSFALPCRNGATYRVGTELAGDAPEGMADLKLAAIVYAPDKKTTFTYTGDLSAGGCIKFKATENGTYYVKISVKDGQGVDYGPYAVKCAVSLPGTTWGYLDVQAGGVSASSGAGWSLKGESAVYPLGKVAMPVGTYTVSYATVKGWSAPAGGKCTVKAEETTTLKGNYSDTYDHGDDVIGGAISIAPKAAGLAVSRSLWVDDPADWMKFTTVKGYYDFALDENCGDATITVYASDQTTVLVAGTSVAFTCRESGKTYYVKVAHADDAAKTDSQYVLTAKVAQTGVVGFEKTTCSFANSATKLSVKVTRTGGSSGKTSVRYHTQSGEGEAAAKAGEDYEPVKGTLEWADGDTTAKTITVPLLPQLVAQYAADKTFSIELETTDVPEEEMEEGEHPALIDPASTLVTITSAVAAQPGTLQFAGTSAEEDEDGPTSTADSASVRAGEKLRLWFARTVGTNGVVGLTVSTKNGTAKAGTNYEAISAEKVRWQDGQTELQSILLDTTDLGTAYQASVALTVNIAIDKTCSATATLGTKKTLAVTIVDPNVTGDFASFQKTCKSLDGITVASTGTWYFDEDGNLTHVPLAKKKASATLTYTLTGPGTFSCCPIFDDGGKTGYNTGTYALDGGTAQEVDGNWITLDIASGTHTLVFKSYRGASKGSEPQMTFSTVDGVLPFIWEPVRKPVVESPLTSEFVGLTPTLSWASAGDNVSYRLYVKNKVGSKWVYVVKALICEGTSYTFEPGQLAAGTTYYWRVDTRGTTSEDAPVYVNGSFQTFTTAPLAAGASDTLKTLFRAGSVDATGEVIETPADGMPYEVALVQGVDATMKLAYSNAVSGATVRYALVDSKNYPLPTGLSVTAKGTIQGWPTTKGTFTTLLQATETVTTGTGKSKTSVATKGETLKVTFTVSSQALAAGTFTGLVSSDDEYFTTTDEEEVVGGLAAAKIGSVSLTVATTPKASGVKGAENNLAATVRLAGTDYVFTQSCWKSNVTELADCGLPGMAAELVNVTQLTYKPSTKQKTVTVTNRLTITTVRASSAVQEALDRPMDLRLELTLPSEDGVTAPSTRATWEGQALRKNTSYATVKAGLAPFAGYYTVALAPQDSVLVGDNNGVTGRGYLTMTVAANGTVQYAGKLGDGATAVSGSATASYFSGEKSWTGEGEVVIPVYQSSAKFAFGGWIRLALDEDGVAYVESVSGDDFCDIPLTWCAADAAKTYSGKGFIVEHEPVGGYYNTVVNLQRYYYDQGLGLSVMSASFVTFSEYLTYLLDEDEYLLAFPGVTEDGDEGQMDLTVAGNAITAPTTSLKYREDDPTLVDWIKSTNPCALTFKFTRSGSSLDATGVYSGTAGTYKGDSDVPGCETEQEYLKKCAFRGVLLLSRDSDATLIGENEVAPGTLYATLKAPDEDEEGETVWTRSVKTSVPFAVETVEKTWEWQEEDWTEGFEADE